jgi:rare lipoprotein A
MTLKKIIKAGLFVVVFVGMGLLSFSRIQKISSQSWKGIASFYHHKFNGRKTANGEIFSNSKLTAANNFLSLGTLVKVMNVKNGKSVIVKINDRMNAANKRLIDLSHAAASQIGLVDQGVGEVTIELVSNADLALK